MALVSNLHRRLALAFVALLLVAPRAQAETVTHQFTGQLTTITNGSGGLLDLTGVFTPGQAVTLDYTIERATPPVQQDPYTSAYSDAITALAFSVGTWSGSGTPAYSNTTVSDNVPSPGLRFPQTLAVTYDQYSAQVQGGIAAPPIGAISLLSLTWTFDDVEGTVFGSTAIPGVFPDLAAFEGKTVTILVFDSVQLKSGYVMATFSGVSTPAQASTWGDLKARYR